MRTSELVGPALDWAVAKCEGYYLRDNGEILKCCKDGVFLLDWNPDDREDAATYAPSLHWAQGGPIIEREKIAVSPSSNGAAWVAHRRMQPLSTQYIILGPTPLIAAMRCYVASKLGDTVEIPTELL